MTERQIDAIAPIEGPRSVADQVADRLRHAIISGGIQPGSRLPETHIAEKLGVSRIPVREALARLEAEGLVKRVPYRGTMVVKLTVDQVKESFVLRALLEGFATKAAAPHLSPDDLSRLRKLVRLMAECSDPRRHDELPEIHRQFHSIIYSRCGYSKLITWIEELYDRFPKNLRRTFRFVEPVEECGRIVDALEAGDAELAGKLMSEHLMNGGQITVQRYAEMLSASEGDRIEP